MNTNMILPVQPVTQDGFLFLDANKIKLMLRQRPPQSTLHKLYIL